MTKNFAIVSHCLRGSNCTTSVLTSSIPFCCLSPLMSLLLEARSCNDWMLFWAAVRTDGDTIANTVPLFELYQMLLLSLVCSPSSCPRYNAKRKTRDHSSGTWVSKKTFGLTVKDFKREESQGTTSASLPADEFVHCMSTWVVSKYMRTNGSAPSCFNSTQYLKQRVSISTGL